MTAVPAGSTSTPPSAVERRPPEPITLGARPTGNDVVVKVFVVVPFLALLATLPFAWGWGLTALDAALAAGFYLLTLTGITVGYHRHFTHRSFKAVRPSGSSWPCWAAWRCRGRSSPGSPTTAATTPSPTRRATRTPRGCSGPHRPRWPAASGTPTSGGCSARDRTNPARFAPDLLADRDTARINRQFPCGRR